jgi:hypothetical protein
MDGIGSSIRIDTRGAELMRILPRSNGEVNQQWISDKARFSCDALKSQRLHHPMVRAGYANRDGNAQDMAAGAQRASAALMEKSKQALAPSTGQAFITVSWERALTLVRDKIQGTASDALHGVVGPFIDQESILLFKRFFNKLGSSQLHLLKYLKGVLDMDLRSNYLLNTTLTLKPARNGEAYPIDYILLVGTNPRYEASVFNVRLRQMALGAVPNPGGGALGKNAPRVASVGFATDLTYGTHHLGNGASSLFDLARGKSLSDPSDMYELLCAKNPKVISGIDAAQSDNIGIKGGSSVSAVNSAALIKSILEFREKLHVSAASALAAWESRMRNRMKHFAATSSGSASIPRLRALFTPNVLAHLSGTSVTRARGCAADLGINVLHAHASTAGFMDLGVRPGRGPILKATSTGTSSAQVLYLLGADAQSADIAQANETFVIYQGHHGPTSSAAQQIDVILPSTSYVEKSGTYVNTEGRVQRTQRAVPVDGSGFGVSVGSPTDGIHVHESQLDNALTVNDARGDWEIVKALGEMVKGKTAKGLPGKTGFAIPAAALRPAGAKESVNLFLIKATLPRPLGTAGHASTQRANAPLATSSSQAGTVQAVSAAAYTLSLNNACRWATPLVNAAFEEAAHPTDLYADVAPHMTQEDSKNLQSASPVSPLPFAGPSTLGSAALQEQVKEQVLLSTTRRWHAVANSPTTKPKVHSEVHAVLRGSPHVPLFDNYYLTDSISRSSVTMGKCSAQFRSTRAPFLSSGR